MNAHVGRRAFFKAMAALPVFAKEAAGKMGLEGVLGGTIVTGLSGDAPRPKGDDGNWLKKAISRFHTNKGKAERRESARGWGARRLDPDIASMRSISPAAAYTIQVERTLERDSKTTWDNLQEQAAERGLRALGLDG